MPFELVVCPVRERQIASYYSLAVEAGSRRRAQAGPEGAVHYPIPVMVLAQLAVDIHHQGRKSGGVVRDAILRTLQG
jgi:hypothetical protein